jgi:SM-20-related protein
MEALRGRLPPHLVLHDFLDDATVAGLLDYAVAHEARFEPTRVGATHEPGAIDPAMRVSTSLGDLGPFRPLLRTRIFERLPTLVAQLRTTPPAAPRLEIELVAHGDGAFYQRHIDLKTAIYQESERSRMLSGVYYFHAQPKAFTGGALRLYAIGGQEEVDFVDIEPAHNSFLVFLSWAPHEVLPVACLSKRFVDSRFAINCWVHGKRLGT